MKKQYQHIIFDLDGTLLNSEKINAIGLLHLLQTKADRTDLNLEDILPKMGRTGTLILKDFDIPKENIQEYLNEWIEIVYQESQNPVELFNGVTSLLTKLTSNNITCGIVSSKNREIYNREKEYLNIHDYFTHIVLEDDTLLHKPHPAPLLKYLELSSSTADNCLYIGDTYSDFVCARDSNIDFGLAAWGSHSLFEQEKNILRFHHPEDILNIL